MTQGQGMRRIEEGAGLPPATAEGPDALAPLPAPPAAALDDATLAYVLASRPAFEGLRQAAGQLAGLLVLIAAGGRSAQDHPMLPLAGATRQEAGETLRGLAVPLRAAHHHRHLAAADRALAAALAAAQDGLHRRDFDPIMEPLRAGYRHLQWAAAALPGFEIVAFGHACCARHERRTSEVVAPRP